MRTTTKGAPSIKETNRAAIEANKTEIEEIKKEIALMAKREEEINKRINREVWRRGY